MCCTHTYHAYMCICVSCVHGVCVHMMLRVDMDVKYAAAEGDSDYTVVIRLF